MRYLPMLLMALGLALLPACQTPIQMYATRAAAMREAMAPRLALFEGGEQPAIVVDLPEGSGWGQRIGTVFVDDALSGRTVWRQSQLLREGFTHYFLPPNLPRGTFRATLLRDDENQVRIILQSGDAEPEASLEFQVR